MLVIFLSVADTQWTHLSVAHKSHSPVWFLLLLTLTVTHTLTHTVTLTHTAIHIWLALLCLFIFIIVYVKDKRSNMPRHRCTGRKELLSPLSSLPPPSPCLSLLAGIYKFNDLQHWCSPVKFSRPVHFPFTTPPLSCFYLFAIVLFLSLVGQGQGGGGGGANCRGCHKF